MYKGNIGDVFIGWSPAGWLAQCIYEWEKVSFDKCFTAQEGSGGGKHNAGPAPHLRPLSFRAKVKDTKQFPRHPPPFVTGSLIPAAGRYILHTRLCSFGHNSHAQEIGKAFTLAVRHQRKGSGEIINNFPPLTRLILATIKTVQGNVDFKKVQIQEIACTWKILAGICLDHKFALHQKLVIDFCVKLQSLSFN